MHRIPVIDAIRFLAAAVVVLHHGPVPPMFGSTLYRELFFGGTAVIVFFVVSGICIHGPLAHVSDVDWRSYFIRRYVRILIPVAVIVPLGALFGVSYHPYYGFVTWSIVAELVYYSAYPLLRAARLRFGWPRLIAASFLVGYGSLALWSIDTENIWLRAQSDVISNLPAWLLGCAVAEKKRGENSAVWLKRLCIIVGSFAVAHAHYAWGLRFNWTLPAFSIVIAIWLRAEIARAAPETILSRAGQWSYSLYLIHPLAIYGIAPLLSTATTNLSWLTTVLLASAMSYVFFLTVERPSHQLARHLVTRKIAVA